MSNIFDALQRAESEDAGAESPAFSLATDLLQAAEQKVRDAAAGKQHAWVRHPIRALPNIWCRPRNRKVFESEAGKRDDRAESMDPTPAVSSLGDLERCPVLQVSIPEDSCLVSVGKEESLGAEKFRFLAVRLRHLRQSRPLKKILITSSIPQEGKSTVAANLACTLARRRQQKTLLLEGDLRRPTLSARFGLGRIPGVCEWLSGQTESINLYRLESLGLWVLPAGAAPQNPAGIDAIW